MHPRTPVCTPAPWCVPQDPSLPGELCFGRTRLQSSAVLCCWKVGKQETCPGHRHAGNRQLAGQSLAEGTEPAVLTPRLSSGELCCWPAHTALTGSAAPELQGRKVQNKYGACDRHRENNIKQGNPSSSKHYSRWQKQRERVAKRP